MGVLFAAIDPSIACTAVSIIRDDGNKKFTLVDKVSLSTRKTKYTSRWVKKTDMFELFEFFLKDKIKDISFFVFENYSYGSIGHLADLGELNGMFKKYISDNGLFFDIIAPSSVKKIVTGNGRSSKEEVAAAVFQYLTNADAVKFNNLDESDSVAIGIAYALNMQDAIDGSK